jgi:NhaP-type Na+/H+ and K+/H+ antiporter
MYTLPPPKNTTTQQQTNIINTGHLFHVIGNFRFGLFLGFVDGLLADWLVSGLVGWLASWLGGGALVL